MKLPNFQTFKLQNRALLLALLLISFTPAAQAFDKQALADTLTAYANSQARVGKVQVNRVRVRKNTVSIYAGKALSCMPIRQEDVRNLHRLGSQMVLGHARGNVQIFTDGHEISELVPQAYRANPNSFYKQPNVTPLTRNTSRAWQAPNGLDNRHLALYGSHGLYYNQTRAWWMYQRAKLLTTVEDLYTTSYVRPFLVPMLENAGAVVLQARERDTQTEEVIVDNTELTLPISWQTSADSTGWQTPTHYLHEGENPFHAGNYAFTNDNNAASLIYTPTFNQAGEYAVYVSYKTLPTSTKEAEYTIVHKGQKTTYKVNQQMGGSTWIYLGTFAFDVQDPANNYVSLNAQPKDNKTLTSDAIRFGGGMGSVERYRSAQTIDNVKSSEELAAYNDGTTTKDSIDWSTACISGVPRYMEGARYWFQYSGIPDSVYNYTGSQNDYIDDYASRGRWVNYLAGGSAAHPDSVGLGIPIHAGLAFHTDAGTTPNDSIVGTLMIYTDFNNDQKKTFPNGTSRLINRDLGDYMQTQITEDIRATFAPEWKRRHLQNSSYSEARNPEVPMVLLELLSHQNFADMRYGLDPRFRFIVSRAIYKGMLRFVHTQYGTDYVVQPLPVQNFKIDFAETDKVHLTWQERIDSLEATAKPTYYIVHTRVNDGDWDNGTRVKSASYEFQLERGKHYDFRIQAGNKGGVSLFSETLSAGIAASDSAQKILIINGFTRVSAPESFVVDSTLAGFNPNEHGVPYGKTLHYIGAQYEFDRSKPWVSDDDQGFGACYSDQANYLMAGNTFDYPSLHGKALLAAGYSYVSTSVGAIDSIATDFAAVDLILGKQRETTIGTRRQRTDFTLFPEALQAALKAYTAQGGNVLASGAYVAEASHRADTKDFAREVLHYSYRTQNATRSGGVQISLSTSHYPLSTTHYTLRTAPNETIFHAENVGGITPLGKPSLPAARYLDSGICAAAAWSDAYRTLVFAFPLESLTDFSTAYLQAINWLTAPKEQNTINP